MFCSARQCSSTVMAGPDLSWRQDRETELTASQEAHNGCWLALTNGRHSGTRLREPAMRISDHVLDLKEHHVLQKAVPTLWHHAPGRCPGRLSVRVA